ncbi:MAG TPA: fibronectin type III domain-containing protein, partial [Lachnospiraceae bacterium]|nr:fibronectin type III domain-containing protein [Lachnospiraceae bacterium]
MKLLNLLKKIMIPALLVWICIPLKTSASEYGNLLTEPYLQCPTDTTVNVVWFTKSATADNYVLYGNRLSQKAYADTSRLSRIRTFDNQPVNIYRHEAVVTGLPLNKTGNERVPYQAVSDGSKSGKYYLQAQEQAEAPMKILFTSDCQLKEMSAANYEKAVETAGHIDAVFYAGDLVNIPDQADEWFPLENSNAFFSLLQGSADQQIGSTVYHGGSILQEAPIYTAPGNHEFMGRTSTIFDLGLQFNDTRPAKYGDSDNTFNTITYEELFDIPSDQEKLYYAVTIG